MFPEERSETLLFSDAIGRLINFTHDNYGSSFLEDAKDVGYKFSEKSGQLGAIEKIDQIIKQWGAQLSTITEPEARMKKFKELVAQAKNS